MYMPGNPCLHPLELAALLHGRPERQSKKDRYKELEKKIEKAQRKQENIEDKIERFKTDLANSLDDAGNKYDALNTASGEIGTPEDAVNLIENYIAGEVSGWENLGESGNIDPAKAPWADDSSSPFTSNGRIKNGGFCREYAKEYAKQEKTCNVEGRSNLQDCQKTCEKSLDKLREQLDNRKEYDEKIYNWEEELGEIEPDDDEDEETEANTFCFECLEELRDLDGPTTGQVVGNALSILAGGAMSYYGYRAGKKEALALNNLRVRQGYDPISSSGLSWAGASLGLPFISNGIHGLAGGHSRFGSFACSPGSHSRGNMYSPFQFGAGAGFHGGGNPWASAGAGFGGNPWGGASAGFQFGGGPFGGNPFGGASAGFQFGGGPFGGNPWSGASAGFQFGGSPFGGNPFGGASAGFQFGGSPFGGNPFGGASAGFQFGGGMTCMAIGCPPASSFGGNPWAGAGAGFQFGGGPGMNAGIWQQQRYSQYIQFQQQQMQARIKMQQAWLQHQQSVQKDWMQRQEVISSLTQEIYRIRQQIQLVSSGGVAGNSILGASNNSLNTGLNAGAGSGPQHTPAPTPAPTTKSGSGEVPLIIER